MGSKTRMIVGSMLAVGGMLMVANGIIAGPHAFGGGQRAVLWLVSAGVVALAAGVWELVHTNAC